MFSRIAGRFYEKSKEYRFCWVPFGYVLMISFPGFYFLNLIFNQQVAYENLYLRIAIGILGAILIFHKKLLIKEPISTFFWYATIIFSLPFFFTFMFLNNANDPIWAINGLVGLVILTFFTDWLTYVLTASIGIAFAVICYWFNSEAFALPHNIVAIISSYSAPIIYFIVFYDYKDKAYQEKLRTAQALGGMIAHEIRTPLACLNIDIQMIAEQPVAQSMRRAIKRIHWIINNLLINIKDIASDKFLHTVNIHDLIETTLQNYPLASEEQEAIHLELNTPFLFKTNPDLFVHALDNLLKNALYAIKKKDSGVITIRTYHEDGKNILEFTDTGCGMTKQQLYRLFETFFTTKPNGVGLGLAFVKRVVQSSGGTIICTSEPGEFTTFLIQFIPVSDNK